MRADTLTDLVIFINYGDRLVVGRIDPPAFADQRLVRLEPRRAKVSEVRSSLMAAGVLTYRRGQVEILDRDILQRYSCGCYARARAGRL